MNSRTPRVIPVHAWSDVYQARWDAKVRVDDETGCINWIGGTTNGYGIFALEGDCYRAHRIAYALKFGNPADIELVIDHLCRNRPCVNPDHLEAVPQRINFLRGEATNVYYVAATHCKKGHPFSGDNLYVHANGRRQCKECHRRAQAQWRLRTGRTRSSRRLSAEDAA